MQPLQMSDGLTDTGSEGFMAKQRVRSTTRVTTIQRMYREGNVIDVAAYSIPEVARYLDVPRATLRYWTAVQPAKRGTKRIRPVIETADAADRLLSFRNVIEVHVLDALRRCHRVPLQRVRIAVEYLRDRLHTEHPLADPSLQTDGIDLFVEKYGSLINISRAGQTAMRDVLVAHLRRIERDRHGVPARLFPFTRKHDLDEPRVVVMDPRVQFGRPVLVSTGIPTSVIAERYKAGESIAELARDYRRDRTEIEEAIRCELRLAEAA